eukprot:CAMPEP_0182855986 /NCGR_PEP_ID=MMETSP0034_2-20130328/2171_1 /TAXON_ID=156128 /ORGANISM="Nephroselmis pyriformis, Strain CCMP717" /LENGTH=266 /DNA_ID=CAMNT_0024987019 /DNA_START=178 /DNA_END=978 /DNA_ORIENTATION=+
MIAATSARTPALGAPSVGYSRTSAASRATLALRPRAPLCSLATVSPSACTGRGVVSVTRCEASGDKGGMGSKLEVVGWVAWAVYVGYNALGRPNLNRTPVPPPTTAASAPASKTKSPAFPPAATKKKEAAPAAAPKPASKPAAKPAPAPTPIPATTAKASAPKSKVVKEVKVKEVKAKEEAPTKKAAPVLSSSALSDKDMIWFTGKADSDEAAPAPPVVERAAPAPAVVEPAPAVVERAAAPATEPPSPKVSRAAKHEAAAAFLRK